MFRGLNLSQDQAQTLVDFYTAKTQEAYQQRFKLYQELRDTWRDEVKADPEIGGKLDVVRTTVAKAIDSLGDPKLAADFRQAMDFTGAGDNPAFIKAFYRLAQKVTEGSHVAGKGPSPVAAPGTPMSAAQRMYPNLP